MGADTKVPAIPTGYEAVRRWTSPPLRMESETSPFPRPLPLLTHPRRPPRRLLPLQGRKVSAGSTAPSAHPPLLSLEVALGRRMMDALGDSELVISLLAGVFVELFYE